MFHVILHQEQTPKTGLICDSYVQGVRLKLNKNKCFLLLPKQTPKTGLICDSYVQGVRLKLNKNKCFLLLPKMPIPVQYLLKPPRGSPDMVHLMYKLFVAPMTLQQPKQSVLPKSRFFFQCSLLSGAIRSVPCINVE